MCIEQMPTGSCSWNKGFESAKDKANQLCRALNLKWDQVKFKSDRLSSGSPSSSGSYRRYQSNLVNPAGGGRIEYASRYNRSKRMTFRGFTDAQGNYHDSDSNKKAPRIRPEC